jgi:hypothetical protein
VPASCPCRGVAVVKPHPPQDVAAEKRKRLALEKLRQLEERLKQQIAESAYLSKKLEDGSIDAATATTWIVVPNGPARYAQRAAFRQ